MRQDGEERTVWLWRQDIDEKNLKHFKREQSDAMQIILNRIT